MSNFDIDTYKNLIGDINNELIKFINLKLT